MESLANLGLPVLTTFSLLPALAMYLDAKLHLSKDLDLFRRQRATGRAIARAAAADRVSPYYLIEHRALDPASADREAIWARRVNTSTAVTATPTPPVLSYTFRELLDHANRLGHWLAARGVRRGDLVGLYMCNSPDFLFAWVGLWAVGAAPAMLNYHLRGDALVHCIRVSGARLVLVGGEGEGEGENGGGAWARVEEVRDQFLGGEGRGGVEFVRMDDPSVKREVASMPTERLPDEPRRGIKPADPLALFYTSGTTGRPKGCPMATGAAYGFLGLMGDYNYPTPGKHQRYYICMPFFHATGGLSAIGQLVVGDTVCIAPRFSVSSFWSDIRDSRATCFVYVGEVLRYLLAAPPSPLDKEHQVRFIIGNGLRPDVWRRFRDRFGIEEVYEFYNSSEAMLALYNPSRNDYTADAIGHHGLLQRWMYHNVYVPVAVDVETGDIVRDPKTGFARRVPYGVGGEILINLAAGKQFAGYRGDSASTEKKIVRDVFKKGDRYYRTGDAMRRDGEGRWFFLDRLGDTFRWKGENVSTAEVSEILGRFPGVLEAIVYGIQLPGHDGKAGMAAIFLDPKVQGSFDYRGFLRHARAHLPRFAVPLFLRRVQEPSSTHNHKQNKVPLRQEGVDPDKVTAGDRIFWVARSGKGDTYVPFTRRDWQDLQNGRARL